MSSVLNNKKISVIIPVYNSFKRIPSILHALNEQKHLPYEVIIIDSGNDGKIESYIFNKKFNFLLIYKKIDKAFPGKARNVGVQIAKGDYFGFIDARTIPDIYWIQTSFSNINVKNIKCSIGHVKVEPNNVFQQILRASSSGLENKETIVGTVIEKDLFYKTGFFIENTRAGEDIEWINRVKKFKKNITKRLNLNINYLGLPINLIQTINKYIIYSFHTAKVDIQQNMKNSYFIISLLILYIILAKWNSLIRFFIINSFELNANFLYIENIFQKFIFFIGIFLILKILIEIIFYKKKYIFQFNSFFILITLIISFYFIYNWNFLIAGWVFDVVWYVPHITKIFIIITLISSLIIRGIIIPLSRNIQSSYLFPFNWLRVGLLGVLLDLSKAPGYLIGSLALPFLKIINNVFLLDNVKDAKKILVICPFPEGVQAGQRLKYEQHFSTFRKNNYIVHVRSFINLNSWNILYKKGYYINKFIGMMLGYLKRFFTIFILYRYDIIYVFMWVTPYGPGLMERVYRFFSKKIIYDIEDNILVIKKNEINPTSRFKSVKKIIFLIKNSDQIITSAPNLNEKCKSISLKNNCTYICASIDLKRYIPNIEYNNNKLLTIGWTGTFSSKSYLKLIEPVFKKLYKLRKFKLRIIGNFDYHLDGVDYEVIQWNKEKEIKDLNKIDIGFYPLNMDEEWVSGKSGLKALQYMSLGIPTIASNIGNVSSIIKNMNNGILVNTNEEWLEAFIRLIDNPDLRKKIGIAGRRTVINHYSTDVLTKKYLKVIKSN